MELKKLFEVKENKEINIRIQCLDTDRYIAVYTLTSDELKLIDVIGDDADITIKKILSNTSEDIIKYYCESLKYYKACSSKYYKAYGILREFIAQSMRKYRKEITTYKNPQHSLEQDNARKINSEILNHIIKEAIKSYCNDLDDFVETYRQKIDH